MDTEAVRQGNNTLIIPKLYWEHAKVPDGGRIIISDEIDEKGKPFLKIRKV